MIEKYRVNEYFTRGEREREMPKNKQNKGVQSRHYKNLHRIEVIAIKSTKANYSIKITLHWPPSKMKKRMKKQKQHD